MAINLNHSIIEHKKDVLLDPAYTGALERGMVMCRSGYNAAGEALYKPSEGVANEVVAGVLWLASTNQAEVSYLEELTVPSSSPYTLTLKFTPTAVAEMSAYNASTLTAITVVAGAPGAGQLGIDLTTKVVTADSTLAGVDVVVVYRYTISEAELERRAGVRSINNKGVESAYGQVTLCYGNCTLYVSNFDTEDAFQLVANVAVESGAEGRLSIDGDGTAFASKVQAPKILLTPGLEQAFVGIDCNLPG